MRSFSAVLGLAGARTAFSAWDYDSPGTCYYGQVGMAEGAECEVSYETCENGGGTWYAEEYVVAETGCCLCDAGCDHALEDASAPHRPDGGCATSTPVPALVPALALREAVGDRLGLR